VVVIGVGQRGLDVDDDFGKWGGVHTYIVPQKSKVNMRSNCQT
jgi:hypothetical protein